MATTQVILPWSVNFWPCYRAFPCYAVWPLALKGTVGGRSGTDSGSSRASSVRDSSGCGSGWNVSHNLEREKRKYVFIDGSDLSTGGGIVLSTTQSAFSDHLLTCGHLLLFLIVEREKQYQHNLPVHANGFSPVWTTMCVLSWWLNVNDFWHTVQWKRFSPWVRRCWLQIQ